MAGRRSTLRTAVPTGYKGDKGAVTSQTGGEVHAIRPGSVEDGYAPFGPGAAAIGAAPAFGGALPETMARFGPDEGGEIAIRQEREIRPAAGVVDGNDAFE
jgi:hypothetical protein